jgi:CRP-like cAMP-binding protein
VYQAQQPIFKQGDVGDYMYIILKGKISVHVFHQDKKGVNILVASPTDGECFGELALIDFNKIKTVES